MLELLSKFAQYSSDYSYSYSTSSTNSAGSAAFSLGLVLAILIFVLVLYVFGSVCLMKIFKKAGRSDAWAAWIPLYNNWVYFEIAGRPGWWALLSLISPINTIVAIIAGIDLAKLFGKDTTFGWLLLGLFPFIGYIILAFGNAQYQGAMSSGGGTAMFSQAPPAPTYQPQPTTFQQPPTNSQPPVQAQPPVDQQPPTNTQPPVGPQPPVV